MVWGAQMSGIKRQYVVTRMAKKDERPLKALLVHYPQVEILDELNRSTVLIQMPPETCRQMAQEHPALIIEPNLLYEKL
jgi:hypothetical protein